MKEKDEYVKKLKAKIDEWNADIDKLKAKADQVGADARIEYKNQIDKLKSKRREVEKKLSDINTAGDDAWEDIKTGADIALKAMNNAIKSAMSRFQ